MLELSWGGKRGHCDVLGEENNVAGASWDTAMEREQERETEKDGERKGGSRKNGNRHAQARVNTKLAAMPERR